MKILAAFFALCMGLTAQVCSPNVVCGITADGIGDSSMRVIFNFTGTINSSLRIRCRYNTTSTSGGTGGYLQSPGTSVTTYRNYASACTIGGMAPSTLYYVSPEVSTDAGANYSTGTEATFTTLARTITAPIPPIAVSTTYPAQSGMVWHVLSDCSDLQAIINAASWGDTIVVPMGTVCSGGPYTIPNEPNLQTFTPAQFKTSDSSINKTGIGLLYSENQELRVSTNGPNSNCTPGMVFFIGAGFTNCDYGGGSEIRKGGKLYAHNLSANSLQLLSTPSGASALPGWVQFTCDATADTITLTPTIDTAPAGYAASPNNSTIAANTKFQVRSPGTLCGGLAVDTDYYWLTARASTQNATVSTQISLTSGGAALDITSTGTGIQRIVEQGSGATHYLTAARAQSDPWLVIVTSGTLPGAAVRVSSANDAEMFHIRKATVLGGTTYNLAFGILTQNVRFEGMIQDTATNTDYLTTTDPRPYCGMLSTNQDNRNIVFNQTRVQGPGYPNRFGCSTAIFLNGSNIVITNSDWRGMDYWHPWDSGFAGTFTTSTATIGAGSAFTGASIFGTKTSSTNTVITIVGGSGITSASAMYVYFGMDGHLKVLPITGLTVSSCAAGTGIVCDILANVVSPNWPVDGNGRTAGVKIATITMSGGNITANCSGPTCVDAFSSPNALEGAQSIIAGNGPGPWLITNNTISGTGIPLHFDDAGGPLQPRSDYTITANSFIAPASQIATQAGSDTLRYGHRQLIEWKGGQRIKIYDNTFTGSFGEMTPATITAGFTARAGGYITDVDIQGNTFTGAGVNLPNSVDSQNPPSKPSQRVRVYDNLLQINGYTHYVIGVGNPRGWCLTGGYGSEDYLIDHNTCFDNRGGTLSFMYWTATPTGGMTITNNILFYSGPIAPFAGENVAGCTASVFNKAMLDCSFTNGPGVPGYTFAGNVIVPWWQTPSVPSGIVADSTVTTALGTLLSGGTNYLPLGALEQDKLNTIKFVTANLAGDYVGLDLHLQAASPYYHLGTDGLNIGWLGKTTPATRRRQAILIARRFRPLFALPR